MPPVPLRPYWTTKDRNTIRLYLGDVIAVLSRLPPKSVQCVVTSPPYWGLRSYLDSEHEEKGREIGAEKTPEEYVAKMVAVFAEVRRVLRDDGTVWLNLGDTYGGTGGPPSDKSGLKNDGRPEYSRLKSLSIQQEDMRRIARQPPTRSLASGNLVGIPWRVALALQADGWVLRQDIIWAKPSPMPESVKNRCTKAHEYIFLLTKSAKYYYDAEAIKEKSLSGDTTRKASKKYTNGELTPFGVSGNQGAGVEFGGGGMSNKRSVWNVSSQGYLGAHFATFPPKLIEPCILAGTSARGACSSCGAPWRRITEETKRTRERPNEYVKRTGAEGTGNSCPNTSDGVDVKTLGWEPTCTCSGVDTRPCIVLDPFVGSGTTGVVCIANGRWAWGIDLSETYLRENAIPRIEGELFSRRDLAWLAGREVQKVEMVGKSAIRRAP